MFLAFRVASGALEATEAIAFIAPAASLGEPSPV